MKSGGETAILALLLVLALASMVGFFAGYILAGLVGVLAALVAFLIFAGTR